MKTFHVLVMICALIVLIAQNITETDENLKHQKNCSIKHVCNIKHQSILPSEVPPIVHHNICIYVVQSQERDTNFGRNGTMQFTFIFGKLRQNLKQ